MDIIQKIQEFVPYNEQERKDKDICLQLITFEKDCFLRANEKIHFCASAMVVNHDRTKTLMNYHNIYQSWSWCGGHADGEVDLLQVAIREVLEETGVHAFPVTHSIYAIDVLDVKEHIKRGKVIQAHKHATITYLLEADDSDELYVKHDENSGVAWIRLEEMVNVCSEDHMKVVYQKLMDKMGKY